MTSDFHDLVVERDETLVQGLCHSALNNRRELHEWAEAELKAVLFQAEIQEPLAEGVIGEEVRRTVARLRTISQNDLPAAVREHEEVRRDVLLGGYDDIHDDYRRLELATTRLVQIMNQLLEVRSFIGEQG